MAITEQGDFGISKGTESEVLQDLVNEGVSKTQILGFHQIDSSTVAVLYAN
mgnify:CR=1 FL=1